MEKTLNIIDLFCGCGGFGLGAELAGFKSFVAIDIDATLQSAYKLNFPHTRAITCDIAEMDESAWKLILNGTEIDGIIGGPPCQGYSRMGHSDQDDPRRSLLHDYFRTVKLLQPKFFVMENVEGLLDKKNSSELTKGIDLVREQYQVIEPMVLDASDYGIPTKRKRVIVVGYKKEFFAGLNKESFKPKISKHIKVADAISDFNEPVHPTNDENDYGWNSYKEVSKISQYAIELRKLPPEGLGNDLFIDNLKKGVISGFLATNHTEAVSKRYQDIEQGKIDKISKSKKLSWDGFCPTLRAGTGSDKGSYQAVRPLHPASGRVITVREAARLQGFPDWFGFHKTKWHSFRMIGNSVSPLFSKEILTVIKNHYLIIDNSLKKVEGE